MTIKSLLVKIAADSSEFVSGAKEAEKSLDNFKEAGERLQKVGTALTVTGVAITGAIAGMTMSFANAGDQIKEMSQRTGFSTERLSELKYIASLCGSSLEEMETGLKKMSSAIVDANTGSATMQDTLGRLGLNYKELLGLKPEEQFDRIAGAITSCENPTVRAAAAQDLFGKAGTRLLPMFSEGPKGMAAMSQEAHRLGIVFDQEAANKADALKDSLTTLKASFQGVANTLSSALVPVIMSAVSKITEVIIKIKDWAKEHPGLSDAILKVATVLGILLTAGGGTLLVMGKFLTLLPVLVSGFGMLAPILMSVVLPLGLIAGAAAVAYIKINELISAKNKLTEASAQASELNTRLGQKLREAADAAGMTRKEFVALSEKYGENYAAMAMAISKGKETVELQKSLATVGAAHKEVIDKQKIATGQLTEEQLKQQAAAYKSAEQLKAVTILRGTLTDAIMKATLSEYEYSKWALGQQYTERQAAITKEITDEAARSGALLLAKQAYMAEVAALEKEHRDTELQGKIDFAIKIKEQEDAMAVARIEAARNVATEKATLTDAIKQMTLSELDYKKWALEQERLAEIQRIKDSLEYSDDQKKELLKQTENYYRIKGQYDSEAAVQWRELVSSTTQAVQSVYGNFLTDTFNAFQEWGEGKKTILQGLGDAFKNMVGNALGALKDLITGELLAAGKSIVASQAAAIAGVIKSVMLSIPFPLNLVLVGGAIAAVSALFRAIHLEKGGLITKPTLAMVGERGPEVVIPLEKLGMIGAGGTTLKQYNYFYGDIKSGQDIDEISRRLASRTIQAIERGRKVR